jgi:hypothetical protein
MRKDCASASNAKKLSPLVLACQARYSEIDWKNLSLDDLKEQNTFGENLLHHIIRLKPKHDPWDVHHGLAEVQDTNSMAQLPTEDQLKKIPKHLLCHEVLSQKTKNQASVYFYIANAGGINRLPKELLTKEVLLDKTKENETVLFELINKKQLEVIPSRLIEEDILLETYQPLKVPYLHICAMLGEIKKIPQQLWIDKMGIVDEGGNNLLHWAADGIFEGYPVTPTTKELMLVQNKHGETPLHKARDLSTIPKEFLTANSLSILDNQNRTPIYWAAYRGTESFLELWKELSQSLPLKEDLLLLNSKKGENPFYHICNNYNEKRDKKAMRSFLKQVSLETLEKFKRENQNDGIGKLLREEIGTKKVLRNLTTLHTKESEVLGL